MSTIRHSLFVIAVMATTTCAWADDEPADALDYGRAEAPGVFVWVGVPADVRISEFLTVRIVIRNRREHEPYLLEDIDISNRYFDGFEFDSSTPQPYEIDLSQGTLNLYFGLQVEGQGSAEILIKLRATAVGVFSGDIELWPKGEDEEATRRLQTEVVDQPEEEER